MLAATASIQPELFGVITTTRVTCSGPKAEIDAVHETLAKLGTVFYYTDAVAPAFAAVRVPCRLPPVLPPPAGRPRRMAPRSKRP